MAVKFRKGEPVRQVLPAPITGVVTEMVVSDDAIRYLVQSAGGDSRWFSEDEIETLGNPA